MRTAGRVWVAALLGLAAGALAVGPTAARADVTPSAGTVAVNDRLGERDVVTFYFPGRTGDAAARVRAAAVAGRLPVRGITVQEGTDDGLLHVRLATTVGRRTGLLARRVPGSTLQALDLFHQGHVVLQLHPAAQVDGHPPVVHHDVFARKFEVSTAADVTYRVPLSWSARLLAVLLVLVALPFAVVSAWASTVERRGGDPVDNVHRLQVGMAVGYGVLPLLAALLVVLGGLLLVPDVVLSELAPGVTAWRATGVIAPVLLLLGTMVLADVAAFAGAQPVDRRLRQTDETVGAAGLRFARLLVIGFLPLTAWFTFTALIPDAGPALRSVGFLCFLVAVNLMGPVLVRAAQQTYRLEEPLRHRLLAQCRDQGLRVRDVRGIRTRSFRTANAMITGVLPSFRDVLITDHLLDNLDDDEVDAIVAHEVAHGLQHHLLIKSGAVVGLVVIAEVGASLAATVSAAFGLLPPIVLVGLLFGRGRLGIVLEQRADDYACRQVGVAPVVSALEKLAALNMTKRRTSAFWDAMQQHPGVERRVARLQARTVGTPRAA